MLVRPRTTELFALTFVSLSALLGCKNLTSPSVDESQELAGESSKTPARTPWKSFFTSTENVNYGLVPSGIYDFARCFHWDSNSGFIDFSSTFEFKVRVEQVKADPNAQEEADHDEHDHEEDHPHLRKAPQGGFMLLKEIIVKNIVSGKKIESYSFIDIGDYDNHLDHFLVGRTIEPAIGELDRISFSLTPVSFLMDAKALLQVPKEFHADTTWQFNTRLTLKETEVIKIPGKVEPLVEQKTLVLSGIGCEMMNTNWRLSIRGASENAHGRNR
jgi:hypothetical protein